VEASMKRYEFGLQKVLDYDKFIQKNEADAMNIMQAEYLDMKEKHDALASEYLELKRQYQEDCENGQNAGKAAATGRYIMEVAQKLVRSRAQLQEQMSRIEIQREKLVAVTQDKEMIEKLRTHSWESYQAAERKNDELFIEEFLSNKAAQTNV
jgi:flagellar FliJ protein